MTKAYFIPNGPKNLAPIFPSINFSDISRYYVEVTDTEGNVVATTAINEIGGCCDEDKIRIHFLNYLGGIDALNFTEVTRDHEAKSDLSEKPTQYPLEKPLHAMGRFNVKSNETYLLANTVYSEKEKEWLNELLDSPLTWMEWSGIQGQDDSYIPVIVLDKQFQTVKESDRFIYELRLEIKLSHERFIIRN